MFEHIWQNNKDNFRSPHVNLIGLSLDPVGVRHDGILNVEIHHVFSLKEKASDELAFSCFDRNDGTLRIVQQDNGDSNPVVSHNGHGEAVTIADRLFCGFCGRMDAQVEKLLDSTVYVCIVNRDDPCSCA
jgi:hypothetical protein